MSSGCSAAASLIDGPQFDRIARVLPFLQGPDPDLVRDLQRAAYFAHIPAGHDVFLEGRRVDAIALLISGAVRVYKIGENGHEITLYPSGMVKAAS